MEPYTILVLMPRNYHLKSIVVTSLDEMISLVGDINTDIKIKNLGDNLMLH